jgi:serine/threonine protein kinase/predicted regulator of Ras-like GTPase activity (Roadblock/LC7/MglB family)
MQREEVFEDDDVERGPLALEQETLLDDQFQVGRVLGVGGFGITYLAYDKVLEMVVAVKEYLPKNIAVRENNSQSVHPISSGGKSRDFEFGLERFLQEARTLAKFEDHPNIVRVRTFFEENGTGYFVMNFYEGRTLAEYLAARNGAISEQEVLLIMDQVLDGLEAVHDQNILHRDIDPNNVYLADNGRVILLDFGAARAAVNERTQSMSVVLKRGYAPHEQYHSRGNQGPWTDVYACSATLYRALTGYKPPEAAARMLDDDLVPPEELVPSLSETTNEAVMAGLSIQPDDRPQSISEFRSLLPSTPEEASPEWVGEQRTTDLPTASPDAELQVSATHPCRLYVDGSKVADLLPSEQYALGAEPGTHHLRAVRTDQEADRQPTVTAAETSQDEGHFVSLDEVIWKGVVTADRGSPAAVEIDFDDPDAAQTPSAEAVPDERGDDAALPPTETPTASATETVAAPTPPQDDAAPGASEADSDRELDALLEELAKDLPGFISANVVDMQNASEVAAYTRNSDFQVSNISRAYTSFVQSNRDALDLLGADPLGTTDIVVATSDMYLVARELSQDHYMGVALKKDANLSLARQIVETYESTVLDALPE